MGIRNYWVDKDEMEAKAVQVIRDYLEDCVKIQALFASKQKLRDSIGAEVMGAMTGTSSMYRLLFNVELKTTTVITDLGTGSKSYTMVTAYDNVTVEIQ